MNGRGRAGGEYIIHDDDAPLLPLHKIPENGADTPSNALLVELGVHALRGDHARLRHEPVNVADAEERKGLAVPEELGHDARLPRGSIPVLAKQLRAGLVGFVEHEELLRLHARLAQRRDGGQKV